MAADFDSVVQQAQQMLTEIKGIADALRGNADQAINSAETAARQYINVTPTSFSFYPSVAEPNVYIPQIAPNSSSNVILNEGDKILQSLKNNFDQFFDAYFPDECDYLAKAQAWLCQVIDNGGIALSPEIEALIYGRDKDRIEGEYIKGMDEAASLWASRGFPMPPGALVAAQLTARENADKLLGDASTALAIRQEELRIDTVKFAVERALDFRVKAVAAAADYIQVLMGGYDAGFKVLQNQNDAQARLISAASEYYRVRLGVEELRFKASMATAEFQDKGADRWVTGNIPLMTKRVDAAVAGAQNLGMQASAALNALHTGTSVNASASA